MSIDVSASTAFERLLLAAKKSHLAPSVNIEETTTGYKAALDVANSFEDTMKVRDTFNRTQQVAYDNVRESGRNNFYGVKLLSDAGLQIRADADQKASTLLRNQEQATKLADAANVDRAHTPLMTDYGFHFGARKQLSQALHRALEFLKK